MKQGIVVVAVVFMLAAESCKTLAPFLDPGSLYASVDRFEPALVLDLGETEGMLGNQSRLEKITSYLDGGTLTYQSAFRAENGSKESFALRKNDPV